MDFDLENLPADPRRGKKSYVIIQLTEI